MRLEHQTSQTSPKVSSARVVWHLVVRCTTDTARAVSFRTCSSSRVDLLGHGMHNPRLYEVEGLRWRASGINLFPCLEGTRFKERCRTTLARGRDPAAFAWSTSMARLCQQRGQVGFRDNCWQGTEATRIFRRHRCSGRGCLRGSFRFGLAT
eukprot:SAG31_NODE_3578_length_4103_cov_1.960789_6_plen_152_part_00